MTTECRKASEAEQKINFVHSVEGKGWHKRRTKKNSWTSPVMKKLRGSKEVELKFRRGKQRGCFIKLEQNFECNETCSVEHTEGLVLDRKQLMHWGHYDPDPDGGLVSRRAVKEQRRDALPKDSEVG